MMQRTERNLSNLRIGVLFNSPIKPSKGEDVDYIADAEVEEEVEAVEKALDKLGLKYQRFPLGDDVDRLIKTLREYKPGVVVNLCEAAFGDSHLEMAVPSLLELLKIPYTGSPPLALGLCQNKGLTKDVLRAKGIPTPEYQILNRFEDWKGEIGYPLFVKPLSEDGSIGISRKSYVLEDASLKKQVEYLITCYKQPVIVEKYIDGRELNVAVLGDSKAQVLPISEITFEFSGQPKIVDYPAKWFKESEEYKTTVPVCPAKMDSSTRTIVEQAASKAFVATHCRDYARVDLRLKERTPYVLEVNPNPDISLDGGMVRSLRAAGIPYEGFIHRIILSTLDRKPILK